MALSLMAAGMLYWLEWSVQSSAVRLASALRKQIYVQAHQLGACDLFGGRKMTSSNLLQQSTDIVRRAQVAWWRVVPHAAAFALLMLALAVSIEFLPDDVDHSAGGHWAGGWWSCCASAPAGAALAADRAQHFNEMLLEHLASESIAGQSDQRSAHAGPLVRRELAALTTRRCWRAKRPPPRSARWSRCCC